MTFKAPKKPADCKPRITDDGVEEADQENRACSSTGSNWGGRIDPEFEKGLAALREQFAANRPQRHFRCVDRMSKAMLHHVACMHIDQRCTHTLKLT